MGSWLCSFTAAIAEMLLQSDASSVYLLPALPEDKWPTGEVVGLRGRGAVTVSIKWALGILVEASLQFGVACKGPSVRRLHYKGNTVEISDISTTRTFNFDRALNLCDKGLNEDALLPGRSMLTVLQKPCTVFLG